MKNKYLFLLLFAFFSNIGVFSQSLKDKAYLLVKYDEISIKDSTD